ncbi:hypothetical protein GCM10009347_42020 [Shewanella algicola]|uniref:Nitroreductase n=1 Tax=Shewanella algicola TaxID=640633 RepID=A0A9X1ZFJ5_9GAMM|nr:hypothetical protein [Shewanella algicola]MCL1107795.1 hypothetical protein [Shewanella algicola]GGP73110.1 hypothetical protein GCM10009347_42020 [Shewanella algicola]
MTHSIIKDLSNSYTTKKYDASKRISEENIEIIKEAIRLSASSINSQPDAEDFNYVLPKSRLATEDVFTVV